MKNNRFYLFLAAQIFLLLSICQAAEETQVIFDIRSEKKELAELAEAAMEHLAKTTTTVRVRIVENERTATSKKRNEAIRNLTENFEGNSIVLSLFPSGKGGDKDPKIQFFVPTKSSFGHLDSLNGSALIARTLSASTTRTWRKFTLQRNEFHELDPLNTPAVAIDFAEVFNEATDEESREIIFKGFVRSFGISFQFRELVETKYKLITGIEDIEKQLWWNSELQLGIVPSETELDLAHGDEDVVGVAWNPNGISFTPFVHGEDVEFATVSMTTTFDKEKNVDVSIKRHDKTVLNTTLKRGQKLIIRHSAYAMYAVMECDLNEWPEPMGEKK